MKIAVTGASGHLGSEIIDSLAQKTGKEKIVGITRTPPRSKHWGVEIRQADYNNADEYENALQDINTVVLISGMDAPDDRILQHRNVINAAKKAGVRKFLFTSFTGEPGNTPFDKLLKSYRQTETDIQESGMEWCIGRDGLYIEPDISYIDKYKEAGEVANCAGDEPAPYTTRKELASAYAEMALNDDCNGKIFNLFGEPVTQEQLVQYLNKTFGANLKYRDMSPDEYLRFQKETNGEMMGKIIAGIYTKIRNGELNGKSDFEAAAGRKHIGWEKYFEQFK